MKTFVSDSLSMFKVQWPHVYLWPPFCRTHDLADFRTYSLSNFSICFCVYNLQFPSSSFHCQTMYGLSSVCSDLLTSSSIKNAALCTPQITVYTFSSRCQIPKTHPDVLLEEMLFFLRMQQLPQIIRLPPYWNKYGEEKLKHGWALTISCTSMGWHSYTAYIYCDTWCHQ